MVVSKMNLFLSFLLIFSLNSVGWAQDQSGKRATIDFEDQLIEGKIKKPDLFYLLQQKRFNFKRLIKLREHFIPEMIKSEEDISTMNDVGSMETSP